MEESEEINRLFMTEAREDSRGLLDDFIIKDT